ncbi:MAG: ADYC domain-containing protein [Anaeromyxobacteraceae bacterium]
MTHQSPSRGPSDAPEPSPRSRRRLLASPALAGPASNGTDLNGTDLNGVELNSGVLAGSHLDLHLEGSALVGVRANGTTATGDQLVDMKLAGSTVGGEPVNVRIDGYTRSGDVSRYLVSFRSDRTTGPWQPVCPGGAYAIALEGSWNADGSKTRDPSVVTFACPGGALVKCVDLGYAPWRSTAGGTSLDATHQACTRAIRADYCGNGSPYTQNGNTIDIYDALGVQADTEEWLPEAEWDEAGASCMSGAATRAQVPVTCQAEKLDLACGQPGREGPGRLVVTELP